MDTGLSLSSARQLLDESLLAKERKSNRQGGGSGFWQQSRSSRVVLAIEVLDPTPSPSPTPTPHPHPHPNPNPNPYPNPNPSPNPNPNRSPNAAP